MEYIETKEEIIAKIHRDVHPKSVKTIVVEDGVIAKFGERKSKLNSGKYNLVSVTFEKSVFDDATIENAKEYMKGLILILTNKKNKRYHNVVEDRIDIKTGLRFVLIDSNIDDDFGGFKMVEGKKVNSCRCIDCESLDFGFSGYDCFPHCSIKHAANLGTMQHEITKEEAYQEHPCDRFVEGEKECGKKIYDVDINSEGYQEKLEESAILHKMLLDCAQKKGMKTKIHIPVHQEEPEEEDKKELIVPNRPLVKKITSHHEYANYLRKRSKKAGYLANMLMDTENLSRLDADEKVRDILRNQTTDDEIIDSYRICAHCQKPSYTKDVLEEILRFSASPEEVFERIQLYIKLHGDYSQFSALITSYGKKDIVQATCVSIVYEKEKILIVGKIFYSSDFSDIEVLTDAIIQYIDIFNVETVKQTESMLPLKELFCKCCNKESYRVPWK